MSSEKVPMTKEGQARLREELKRLREVESPQVIKDIATAREHGDLSENAEYHAARERQGMIVARISHIEQTLSRAEVIDPSKIKSDKVQFGAQVTLSNIDTGDEIVYVIVGPEEVDVARGCISVASPLAKALLGHVAGDEIKIKLPAGPRHFEILDVKYGASIAGGDPSSASDDG